MARCSLRACALVALMFGVALSPAAAVWGQANDPFGAPPAAPPAKAADPFGSPPAAGQPAPMSPAPRASAPVAARSGTTATQPAEEASVSATAASAGLRTQGLAEQKILHALDDKTECDFTETPLADVIGYFKDHHHIEIQVDTKALQDEAVDSSVPVTRSLKDVKFKSALRLILDSVNLAYVIRNEVLLITSKTEADALTETRTYPVQELLAHWPAGRLRGENLVEMVTAVVQPTTWDENGGLGAIQLLPGTLVVAQTQAVHEDVAELLALLRRTRKAQVAEQIAEAGNAAAQDGKSAPKPLRIAVYRVPGVDSAGLKESIISLIAPQSWKENGGEGSIQIVRGAAPQKSEAKTDKATSATASAAPVRTAQFGGGGGRLGGGGATGNALVNDLQQSGGRAASSTDLLVVRQTDEVQNAIDDLVQDIYQATGGNSQGGGTSGGGGGAGGGGGGFFRVRP